LHLRYKNGFERTAYYDHGFRLNNKNCPAKLFSLYMLNPQVA